MGLRPPLTLSRLTRYVLTKNLVIAVSVVYAAVVLISAARVWFENVEYSPVWNSVGAVAYGLSGRLIRRDAGKVPMSHAIIW